MSISSDITLAHLKSFCVKIKLKEDANRESLKSPESSLYFARDYEARDEAINEKRRRDNALYQQQVALVEQRKRDAILKRFEEQKYEEDVLRRNAHE